MGLIEDSVAARKAHMTYGQYMAQEKPYVWNVKKYSGYLKIRKKPEKLCEVCGNPVPRRSKRYCCRECYLKAKRSGHYVPL